jgi:hypothetical protein
MLRSVPVRSLLALVLLGGAAVGCASDDTSDRARPAWADGSWTGRLAWEHDTTSHRLRLDLSADRFAYPALGCRGTLAVDSTSDRVVRMRLVAAADSGRCGEVAGGIAELHRLDGAETLHLQYWPRDAVKLYLAQLRPRP